MARSTGVFPREKFDLDDMAAVVQDNSFNLFWFDYDYSSVHTVKVIVIGATGFDNSGDNNMTVYVGTNTDKPPETVVFNAEDFDANGVGIKYIRGSLIGTENGQTPAVAVYSGTAFATNGVWLDAVDNVS